MKRLKIFILIINVVCEFFCVIASLPCRQTGSVVCDEAIFLTFKRLLRLKGRLAMTLNLRMAFIIFFISPMIVYAQSTFNREIPEGMEAVQIGGSGWLIVPQGAKTRKVGAQIIVEGSKEYMSRRFLEMDERFQKMEKNQEDLKKELEALKGLVAGMQKDQ